MGTIAVYATTVGMPARELTASPNGLFTGALLDTLDSLGTKHGVRALAPLVRDAVSRASGGKQKPEVRDACVGEDVFLVPSVQVVPADGAPPSDPT